MQQQTQNKPTPTKMYRVLDHLHEAHLQFGNAMNVLSSMIMDLQKGDDWIVNFIDQLINASEGAGGNLIKPSVEAELREFIPKKVYRGPEEEKNA